MNTLAILLSRNGSFVNSSSFCLMFSFHAWSFLSGDIEIIVGQYSTNW